MNPGPVLRLDLEGTVLRANAAAQHVFRADDLLAASWLGLCPGMNRTLWAKVLESREPLHHEADVNERCFDFTHAHRKGTGQVFVFGADITERFAEPMQRLKDWGFLTIEGDAVRLNRPALLQVDRLLHEFFLPEHRNARYV